MSTQESSQEGVTPEPPAPAECMGRYRHHFEWMWQGGIWLNRIKCMNCGEEREKRLDKSPVS
jgi:hypothetical protein